MGFRRDGEQAQEWKRWLAKHRMTLVRAGIPDWILQDELRWLGFVEEDGWDAESGFKVEMLSPEQARELHVLLVGEYGADGCAFGCIKGLERRLAD